MCLHRQFRRIVNFSCFPETQREGGEFPGQGEAGHVLAHAVRDHAAIEILERAGLTDGCGSRALEDTLQDAIVVLVQAAGQRLAPATHRPPSNELVISAGLRHHGEACVGPQVDS